MRFQPNTASVFRLPSALASRAALACACLMSTSVFAAEPAGKPESSWGIGLGVVSAQKAYTGIDRTNMVLPLLQFENRYVRLFGPVLEVKLPGYKINESQQLNFSLVGRYDASAGYDAGDAPILEGMSDRKRGFWAGGKGEWKSPWLNAAIEWTGDISSYSRGQKLHLVLDRTWRVGEHVLLTPRLAATWLDQKYVDYYYGVRDTETRPGRRAYRGDSGVNAEIGLRSVYRFDRHHAVFLDAALISLTSKIKDSPLVSRSTENRVFLGYSYHFQ